MSIITEIAPQVTIPDGLAVDAELPTVAPGSPCAQGDVTVVAWSDLRRTARNARTPIPADGVTIAVGQGGHHHTLYGKGFFDRVGDEMVYGTLTVRADGMVLLLHTDPSRRLSDEHGALQIGPGNYRIGGQREQADVIRRVSD